MCIIFFLVSTFVFVVFEKRRLHVMSHGAKTNDPHTNIEKQWSAANMQLANHDEVLVSSYLLKKPGSHLSRTYSPWHKRWCVLRRSQLAYYKNSNEHKPTNVIPIEKLLTYKTRDKLKIAVYTTDKTFFFKAETPEIFAKWCKALGELSQEAEGELEEEEPEGEVDEEEEEPDISKLELDDMPELEALSETDSVNNGVKNDDAEFFAMYSYESKEHVIQSGIVYRNRAAGLKQCHSVLTNRHFVFSKERTGIDMAKVVDCVEDEKRNYDGFVVITEKKRYRFVCRNDKELVDWIINFKTLLLARKRRESV